MSEARPKANHSQIASVLGKALLPPLTHLLYHCKAKKSIGRYNFMLKVTVVDKKQKMKYYYDFTCPGVWYEL